MHGQHIGYIRVKMVAIAIILSASRIRQLRKFTYTSSQTSLRYAVRRWLSSATFLELLMRLRASPDGVAGAVTKAEHLTVSSYIVWSCSGKWRSTFPKNGKIIGPCVAMDRICAAPHIRSDATQPPYIIRKNTVY
jgi:hypothetical protein